MAHLLAISVILSTLNLIHRHYSLPTLQSILLIYDTISWTRWSCHQVCNNQLESERLPGQVIPESEGIYLAKRREPFSFDGRFTSPQGPLAKKGFAIESIVIQYEEELCGDRYFGENKWVLRWHVPKIFRNEGKSPASSEYTKQTDYTINALRYNCWILQKRCPAKLCWLGPLSKALCSANSCLQLLERVTWRPDQRSLIRNGKILRLPGSQALIFELTTDLEVEGFSTPYWLSSFSTYFFINDFRDRLTHYKPNQFSLPSELTTAEEMQMSQSFLHLEFVFLSQNFKILLN